MRILVLVVLTCFQIGSSTAGHSISSPREYFDFAYQITKPSITDKYQYPHSYHELYATILLPRIKEAHVKEQPLKLFGIVAYSSW